VLCFAHIIERGRLLVSGERATAWYQSVPLRVAVALLLGVLGFWLNTIPATLLAEGTPEFVFGGAAALLSFVWLGPRLGTLTTVISVAALLPVRGWSSLVVAVYLLEPVVVYWLFGRLGSLVAGSVLYWLTLGALLDRLGYGALLGLAHASLMLLLVKQLLNGFMDALVVEATVWLSPARAAAALGGPRLPSKLQVYVFRRVLFVVLLPIFLLALLYTRTAYQRRVDESQAGQLQAAGNVRARVEAFAMSSTDALAHLARTIELRRGPRRGETGSTLEAFHERHPEYPYVAVSDAAGAIVAAVPTDWGSDGAAVGSSMAGRRYFAEARRRTSPSFPVLVMSPRGAPSPGAGPVLGLTAPLFDATGAFDGLVVAAVDYSSLPAMLAESRTEPTQRPVLLDGTLAVIAALDPELEPGRSIAGRVPAYLLRGRDARSFTFRPQGSAPVASLLGGDLRYAVFQPIPLTGGSVLVELPLEGVQAEMVGVTYSVVASVVASLVLACLVAVYLAKRIASPLVRVNRTAAAIAAGRFPDAAPIVELTSSDIGEFRELGSNLLTMQEGLREYRALSVERERESEERFRATFHQAAVGLAHLDRDLRWQRVNGRLGAILGSRTTALLGTRLRDIVHPADVEATTRAFTGLLEGGQESARVEARFARPEGGDAVTQLTVSLARDDDGAAKFFIAVVEDIADRKRLEADLLQARKMESVGRLAGGVAHDFNNLLTAILGYGEMLERRLAGDERSQAQLAQIQEAGERASRLTRQLLAFARRQVIEPRVVDLNALVLGMEGMLRRLIGEHIELDSRLGEGVWGVRADPSQLEQLLLNLVVNARDAMPEGGRITMTTSALVLEEPVRRGEELPAGRYVRFVVTDTGEGMTDEVKAHVFEPFFTTKEKEQGTGLGLATCYGIVKQSGGDIEVVSQPGRGSSFIIVLPAADAVVEAGEPVSVAGALLGGSERVLVVEDEAAVATMIRDVLVARGYTVVTAADGVEALQRVEQEAFEPELLVTDVVMPHMGGPELAAALRASRPALKVVFASGYSPEAIGRGTLNADTVFLQKPFSPAALAHAVRQVLDSAAPGGRTNAAPATL
jgi:two-component system, cell cycle sensor histidine kinase and response regulator CckA